MDQPLAERVAALAQEAAGERAQLERRKRELVDERDAEIAAVRARYVERTAEIDDELKTIARLQRALNPEREYKRRERKDTSAQRRKQAWRPSAATMATIRQAMHDGAETVTTIAKHPAVTVSSSTVSIALGLMRDESLVRLAGSTGGKGAARRYRLTPEGRDEPTNGRVTVESQA